MKVARIRQGGPATSRTPTSRSRRKGIPWENTHPRNGHEVVMTFVDEAESSGTADRPAFREMTSRLLSSGSSTGFPEVGTTRLRTRHPGETKGVAVTLPTGKVCVVPKVRRLT